VSFSTQPISNFIPTLTSITSNIKYASKSSLFDSICYYPFDTNISNYGNTLNGPVVDATLTQTSGTIGIDTTTYKFGGGSLRSTTVLNKLTLGSYSANQNGYSFSCWFNVSVSNLTGMLFTFSNSSSPLVTRIFGYFSAGQLKMGVGGPTVSIITPTINTWYHMVWTLSKTNQSNVYINGTLTNSFTNLTYFSSALNANYILSDNPSITATEGFNGYIDEFFYFDNIITSQTIASLYSGKYFMDRSGDGLYSVSTSTTSINGNSYIYQSFNSTGTNYWNVNNTGTTKTSVIPIGGGTAQNVSGEWLQIQLPIQLIMTSFQMTSLSNSPTNLMIAGSNDGTIWYNSITCYNPTQINGLQLWLDANDYSTLVLTGSSLTQWNDKSGYHRNATKYGTSSTNATYSSTGFNGLPSIKIANDQELYCDMPKGTTSTAISALIVYTSRPSQFSGLLSRCDIFTAGPIDIYDKFRWFGNSSNYNYISSSFHVGNASSPSLLSFTTTLNSWNEYVNGTSTLSSTAVNYFGDTTNFIYIGTRADRGIKFDGYISEVLVYNKVLTTTERQNLEGYLAVKWNIQNLLPKNHPYYKLSLYNNNSYQYYRFICTAPLTGNVALSNVKFNGIPNSFIFNNLSYYTTYNIDLKAVYSIGTSQPAKLILTYTPPNTVSLPKIYYYFFRYIDVSSNGLNIANYATGSAVFDASMSTTNMITNANNYLSLNGLNYISLPKFTTTTNGISINLNVNSTSIINNSRIFDYDCNKIYNILCDVSSGNIQFAVLENDNTSIQAGSLTYNYGTPTFSNYTTPWGAYTTNSFSIAVSADETKAIISYNINANYLIYFSIFTNGSWSSFTQTLQTNPLINNCRVALSANGLRGIISSYENYVYYFTWNGINYTTCTQTLDTTARKWYGIDMTPDGSMIVAIVSSGSPYFAVWNGSNYTSFTQTLDTSYNCYNGIGISNDKTMIAYSTTSMNIAVAYWNGTNFNKPLYLISTTGGGAIQDVKIAPNNKIIFILTTSQTTSSVLWYSMFNGTSFNAFVGVSTTSIPNTINGWGLHITKDGKSIYATNGNYGYIYKTDITSLTTTKNINNSNSITAGQIISSFQNWTWTMTPTNQSNTVSTWNIYLNSVLYATQTGMPYPCSILRTTNYVGRDQSNSNKFNGNLQNLYLYT